MNKLRSAFSAETRISLAAVFLTISVVSVGLGWYVDRNNLIREISTLRKREELSLLEHSLSSRNLKTRTRAIDALQTKANRSSVPALIYSLTEPNLDICIKSKSILERVANRSFSVSDDESYESLKEEHEKWTSWYLSVDPNRRTFIPYSRKNESNPFGQETEPATSQDIS